MRAVPAFTLPGVPLVMCTLCCLLVISSCTWIDVPITEPAETLPPSTPTVTVSAAEKVTKPVTFAILEDYDKGQDLDDIARDFQLMQELEIDELRCSFGWDDYEPVRGQYDFVWLEAFVTLAAQYDIKLRPYIAYTAPWAGTAGSKDGITWNNPPASQEDWYNFVYNLAYTLRDSPNVLSYEIYNEENDDFWWDGTVEQYGETLKQAALAVQVADPDAEVLLGGLVFPDYDWLLALTEAGAAQYYAVTPFHAYPETWTTADVVVENYLDVQYHEYFVPHNHSEGEAEPIWINEMGFATTPDKTEADQANWFARAVSTFLADPEIEFIGIYEIKDLPQTSAALGDEKNYYLGITQTDRTKKLAFHTVDLLTDLLDVGTLTIADAEVTIDVTAGVAGALYHHLFQRPDGSQVLFIYDKTGAPTVNVTLQTPGSQVTRYALDGSSSPHPAFNGLTLRDIELSVGQVAMYLIQP